MLKKFVKGFTRFVGFGLVLSVLFAGSVQAAVTVKNFQPKCGIAILGFGLMRRNTF